MKNLTCTICILLAMLTLSVLQSAIAQSEQVLKLRLSPAQVRLDAKGEAHLTIEVVNTSNKSLTFTLRPKKGQNLTLNVFENGQFLNAIVGGKLVGPQMEVIGGVQPGFPYQRDETLTLGPGKTKSFKMQLTTAPFASASGATGKIYIDGPSPWGKKLNRDLWTLPFNSDEVTVRFVYKQDGLTASSNDAVLQRDSTIRRRF